MTHGSRDYLKIGDMNAICDECGFKFKLSELVERWDGALVDRKCWEPRHPRDFVRIPRTESPPPTGRPEPAVVETDVTFSTTPTVPSGTFTME